MSCSDLSTSAYYVFYAKMSDMTQKYLSSASSVPFGTYLGLKFGPIPNAKKYLLFPIDEKNFPIWKFWKIVIENF